MLGLQLNKQETLNTSITNSSRAWTGVHSFGQLRIISSSLTPFNSPSKRNNQTFLAWYGAVQCRPVQLIVTPTSVCTRSQKYGGSDVACNPLWPVSLCTSLVVSNITSRVIATMGWHLYHSDSIGIRLQYIKCHQGCAVVKKLRKVCKNCLISEHNYSTVRSEEILEIVEAVCPCVIGVCKYYLGDLSLLIATTGAAAAARIHSLHWVIEIKFQKWCCCVLL